MMEGNGVLKWPNGFRYQGEFKASKMHGEGCYTKNGVQTEGIWEEGTLKQVIKEQTIEGMFKLRHLEENGRPDRNRISKGQEDHKREHVGIKIEAQKENDNVLNVKINEDNKEVKGDSDEEDIKSYEESEGDNSEDNEENNDDDNEGI